MKEISLKSRMLEVLVLLIPFLLITGPFLSDLSVVLCCLLIILIKGKDLINIILENKIYKLIFTFYIYLVFCSLIIPLNENYFIDSFIPSLLYLRFLIFLVVFHYIFNLNKNFSKRLFFYLLLILLIFFIDINSEYFLKINLIGHKFNGVRIQSLFGDEWIVGSYLSKIVPVIITLFFINKKNSRYIFFKIKYDDYYVFIILLISNFLILLSGERSAFFSMALYSTLILFLLKFDKNKKYLFILVVIFTFLISISVLKPTYERMYKHTLNQLNIFSSNYKKDHQLLFETGIKIFNNNKVIGSGLKGFRNQCKNEKYYIEGGCSTHPHNFYILFLSELGLLGFLFLFTLFIILNLIIFFKVKNFYFFTVNKKIFNNDILSILIGLYVFIFPFKTHGAFFNNWLSICFYFQLSLLIAVYFKTKKKYEK
jgi:O-antigen ligase